MRALSVKQPWASALADGDKNIEFRSRPTNYRGELLICSSKSGGNIWMEFGDEFLPMPRGCTSGVRKLVDCRPMTEDDLKEFGAPDSIEGWYAWVFEPCPAGAAIQPVPVNGKISFFDVDDGLIRNLGEGMGVYDYDYPNKYDKVPPNLKQ